MYTLQTRLSQLSLGENYRSNFNEADLQELADSIKSVGLLQKPVVRKIAKPGQSGKKSTDYTYEVISGQRRFLALKLLSEQDPETDMAVEVNVTDTESPEDILILQLTENMQRRDSDPLEEAAAFSRLAECGMSNREIAKKLNINRSVVNRRIVLNKLPDLIKEKVRNKEIKLGQAERLAHLSEADSIELLERSGPTGHELTTLDYYIEQAYSVGYEKLNLAIFDIGMNVGNGPCTECSFCSLNDDYQGLLPEREETILCGQPDCYNLKTETHLFNRALECQEKGAEIICVRMPRYGLVPSNLKLSDDKNIEYYWKSTDITKKNAKLPPNLKKVAVCPNSIIAYSYKDPEPREQNNRDAGENYGYSVGWSIAEAVEDVIRDEIEKRDLLLSWEDIVHIYNKSRVELDQWEMPDITISNIVKCIILSNLDFDREVYHRLAEKLYFITSELFEEHFSERFLKFTEPTITDREIYRSELIFINQFIAIKWHNVTREKGYYDSLIKKLKEATL